MIDSQGVLVNNDSDLQLTSSLYALGLIGSPQIGLNPLNLCSNSDDAKNIHTASIIGWNGFYFMRSEYLLDPLYSSIITENSCSNQAGYDLYAFECFVRLAICLLVIVYYPTGLLLTLLIVVVIMSVKETVISFFSLEINFNKCTDNFNQFKRGEFNHLTDSFSGFIEVRQRRLGLTRWIADVGDYESVNFVMRAGKTGPFRSSSKGFPAVNDELILQFKFIQFFFLISIRMVIVDDMMKQHFATLTYVLWFLFDLFFWIWMFV